MEKIFFEILSYDDQIPNTVLLRKAKMKSFTVLVHHRTLLRLSSAILPGAEFKTTPNRKESLGWKQDT